MATLKQLGQKYLGQRPKRIESLWLNYLGIQIFRIIIDQILYFIRFIFDLKSYPKEILSAAQKLNQDGILIIENFLAPEDFENLKNEYEKTYNSFNSTQIHQRRMGPLVLEEIRVFSEPKSQLPYSQNLIRKNKFIRKVIEAASHRKMRLDPTCVLQRATKTDFTDPNMQVHGRTEFDEESIWHQDHVFSVYKAWLYIDDVTAQNGAFEFLKNSPKFSLARLKYEYKRGVYQQYVRLSKNNLVPQDFIDRGRIVPNEDTKKEMGAYSVIGTGKANTLIIANTMGYHRRGMFAPGTNRKLVHVDFRKLDSFVNNIPLINKFIDIDLYSSQYKN